MRTLPAAAAAVIALFLLAGCGGGESKDSASLSFPRGAANEAGLFYVPVTDKAEADRLCDAVDQWPASYPKQVTFDIPNTGSDVTCLRPTG